MTQPQPTQAMKRLADEASDARERWNVRMTAPELEIVDVYNSFARLARDEAGRLYLLGFCDGDLERDDYVDRDEGYARLDLALPLGRSRLEELERQELDLKSAYLEPEEGELAMAVLWPDQSWNLNFFPAADVFFQYLPGRVPLKRTVVR